MKDDSSENLPKNSVGLFTILSLFSLPAGILLGLLTLKQSENDWFGIGMIMRFGFHVLVGGALSWFFAIIAYVRKEEARGCSGVVSVIVFFIFLFLLATWLSAFR